MTVLMLSRLMIDTKNGPTVNQFKYSIKEYRIKKRNGQSLKEEEVVVEVITIPSLSSDFSSTLDVLSGSS